MGGENESSLAAQADEHLPLAIRYVVFVAPKHNAALIAQYSPLYILFHLRVKHSNQVIRKT
jgi:hypothetical protein